MSLKLSKRKGKINFIQTTGTPVLKSSKLKALSIQMRLPSQRTLGDQTPKFYPKEEKILKDVTNFYKS